MSKTLSIADAKAANIQVIEGHNTVQMIQRFQDAGKSFDLMLYPNKTHSIDGTQTRIRLYSMMLDWWLEELMER